MGDMYKKDARKLYDSSMGTKSWKSVMSERVLKCAKAKGRYNKKVIADAFAQAHAAHTKAQDAVVYQIFTDETTGYDKFYAMLTMHQLESGSEEYSTPDYLLDESSQQEQELK